MTSSMIWIIYTTEESKTISKMILLLLSDVTKNELPLLSQMILLTWDVNGGICRYTYNIHKYISWLTHFWIKRDLDKIKKKMTQDKNNNISHQTYMCCPLKMQKLLLKWNSMYAFPLFRLKQSNKVEKYISNESLMVQ